MTHKLRIAVLAGGPSAEHEVSLNTGEMIFQGLDKNKYEARKIIISKNGRWPISLIELKNNYDLVFNAMHGEYGEDGVIQKILEKNKIPYTGSNSRASKLGMDKATSYKKFQKTKLLIPKFTTKNNLIAIKKLGLPLVIKPNDRGSSVGVKIIKNWDEFNNAVNEVKKYSSSIMFQEFINGRELTCGIIEYKKKLKALLPTEIIPPSNSFFNYEAKYVAGASQEITPPNLSKKIIKQIQEVALKAHRAIGCRGYSRTDMILSPDKKIYVLEINTLPGMTANSLLPQGAKAMGITFSQLLDIIIESAVK